MPRDTGIAVVFAANTFFRTCVVILIALIVSAGHASSQSCSDIALSTDLEPTDGELKHQTIMRLKPQDAAELHAWMIEVYWSEEQHWWPTNTTDKPNMSDVTRPFYSGMYVGKRVLSGIDALKSELERHQRLSGEGRKALVHALLAEIGEAGEYHPLVYFYVLDKSCANSQRLVEPDPDISSRRRKCEAREMSTEFTLTELSRDANEVKLDDVRWLIETLTFVPLWRKCSSANDPLLKDQWSVDKLQLCDAWQEVDESGPVSPVRVCVVDTGVRLTHRDLSTLPNESKDVFPENGDGFDIKDPDNENGDRNGHGTKSTGILGAIRKNKFLIAGIAPVEVIGVNVVKDYGDAKKPVTFVNIGDGVFWGIEHGARVINLSIDGYFTNTLDDSNIGAALYAKDKDVIVCVAAGNSKLKIYPSPTVKSVNDYVAVAAVEKDLTKLRFWSNRGDRVNVSAPGVDIKSLGKTDDNQCDIFSDTSAAAPQVSGLCALIRALCPCLTVPEVKDAIFSTASHSGKSGDDGEGVIQPAEAIKKAKQLEKCK